MSEYIRRGECLEAVAKVNSVLMMFEERIRQIRRDMEKLEAENKDLKDKVQKYTDRVQTLEIKYKSLSARTVGWQNGFGEVLRDRLRRIDEQVANLLAKEP